MCLSLHDVFSDYTEIQIVIGSDFRHVLIPIFFKKSGNEHHS